MNTPADMTRQAINPWVVAVVVAMATFMEVLDTTIANVALPYIAGGLAVSADEASWVTTTYLVANAVSLTASTYLAQTLGRKKFYMICVAMFTISSVMCGVAWNLNSLLLFRLVQGLGGGGMVPLSQSILADSFPPEKRGQAFALFGLAIVVAPVVGPTLGGLLADNVGWEWCFLVNGPVGLLTLFLIWMVLPSSTAVEERLRLENAGLRFDLIGFVLVATFLGSLEIILDRGQEDDWFGSRFIITSTAVCLAALALMVPWLLSRKNPIIDIRLLGRRQFASSFIVMGIAGAILLAATQFLPLLVQQDFGYTATWAGLVLSPGGLATMVTMIAVGRLLNFIQPKYLIAAGAVIVAAGMYDLTRLYAGVDFGFFAWSRVIVGIGLPLIFIPVLTASYTGLPADKTDQASAMMNAARNVGGSIGIAIGVNVLAERSQFHQARLVESVTPSSPAYRETLQQLANYFVAQGSAAAQAKQQAIQWIGEQVLHQASLMAYIDAFWVLMLMALAAVPLALILSNTKSGAAPVTE
jgi:DHA2 family multidrug resistance protein